MKSLQSVILLVSVLLVTVTQGSKWENKNESRKLEDDDWTGLKQTVATKEVGSCYNSEYTYYFSFECVKEYEKPCDNIQDFCES